tara:strand:+ start:3320 stop:4027 length:708 start_codon:yes stop_codon:yes gene_type:complete
MQNNLEYKTFILISPSKYVITVTDVKDEIIFKKVFADTFMDQTREIDYIILNDFLKKNIFEIEKKLKKFIKTVHLIIDNENIYSIYFSIKNKVNIVTLDTKIVNDLLLDAKSCCKDTLKDTDILHMKIDKFCIDNNYYDVFPNKKKCENLSIDLSFICLPNNVLKNIKKLLSEYQISVEKVFSHSYLKSFSIDKSKNIYEIAQKVMFGLNENEVSITNKNPKNKGFFEKFFEFFK